MTKISNQYSLTNILTADLANSRLGINNVSPTVALDVTGAGKFSGALTVTGGIIASAANGNIRIKGSTDGFLGAGESDNKLYLTDWTTGAKGLTILLTTGAATFSSTITSLAASGQATITAEGSATSGEGAIQVKGKNSSGVSRTGSFKYDNSDILRIGTSSAIDMRFETSDVERMRITSGGNVGIGGTTPAVKLQIDGTNAQERLRLRNTDSVSYLSFSEQNITMWRPNDSGAAFVLQTQAISGTWTGGGGGIEFRPLNTLRMTIGPTGNIGAPSGTNIYNASDARLKKNISKLAYGLNTISALNPVKFNWIDGFEPSEDGKYMLGFVAQEVLEILPEAVEAFGTKSITIGDTIIDNPLRVNEKFIIPVLVKAIQELSAKVSLLENK